MKKIISAIILIMVAIPGAYAVPTRRPNTPMHIIHIHHHDNTAVTIAIGALFIAGVSLFVSIHNSVNTPGHIQLARF